MRKRCECVDGFVCRNCKLALSADNGTSPPTAKVRPLTERQRARLSLYGVTEPELWQLLKEQGNRCAICHLGVATPWDLAIDHNHVTGKVRGLLCIRCNQGIGMLKDNPEYLRNAAAYLETHGDYASKSRLPNRPLVNVSPPSDDEADAADLTRYVSVTPWDDAKKESRLARESACDMRQPAGGSGRTAPPKRSCVVCQSNPIRGHDRCAACLRYLSRNGQDRPQVLIARALARRIPSALGPFLVSK